MLEGLGVAVWWEGAVMVPGRFLEVAVAQLVRGSSFYRVCVCVCRLWVAVWPSVVRKQFGSAYPGQ